MLRTWEEEVLSLIQFRRTAVIDRRAEGNSGSQKIGLRAAGVLNMIALRIPEQIENGDGLGPTVQIPFTNPGVIDPGCGLSCGTFYKLLS